MSNLSKYFKGQKKLTFGEGKNKENNLSFRNIAANTQNQHQSQLKKNKVDTSFRSIYEQSSFHHQSSGEDLQQQLNYVGGCVNHPNKRAQYFERISQNQYCKLCAAQLASLGYKIQKSEHFVSRDLSPEDRFNYKSKSIYDRQSKDSFESIIKQTKNAKIHNQSNVHIVPVKFSSMFSQKNKTQSFQTKFDQNQKIIDQFMEIYTQKFDKIQEIINDIRIKDIQYIKKIQSENQQIYENAKYSQHNDSQNHAYDLFGKSLLKDQSSQITKFKLPSEQKIQTLQKIIQALEQIRSAKFQPICTNKIPLIKSINSNSSGNDPKNFLLKNSSSISNLSSKSNFKKEKKENSNNQKFGSQINHTKHFIPEEPIQSSRFSSNSAVVRKKNNQNENHTKTESTEMRRRNNTQVSPSGSGSCQDTPQSLKSKISSNSFVLPKQAAVTMFDKINVCESIDVKAELAEQEMTRNNRIQSIMDAQEELPLDSNRNRTQTQSSYANRSHQNSVVNKERKSFHRYQIQQNYQ